MSQDTDQAVTSPEEDRPEVLFIDELEKYTAQLHGVSKLLEMCAHDDPDSAQASSILALGHSVESLMQDITDSMMVFKLGVSMKARRAETATEGQRHE